MVTQSDITAATNKVCQARAVDLAYLYGSYAINRCDHESDIDLAFLVDNKLTKEERFALRLNLLAELDTLLPFGHPDLDVVILQDSPLLLQYNVICKGVPIFQKDSDTRKNYELDIQRQYDDDCPMLEQESEIILDRILSHAS